MGMTLDPPRFAALRMSNTTLIIAIVVGIVVDAAIAAVGYRFAQQKRTTRLRQQNGPEYDRALDQADSEREAESEVRDRSQRHEKLVLRSLDSSEREDFERRWADVQGQFVDDPSNAGCSSLPGRGLRPAGRRSIGEPPRNYPALSGGPSHRPRPTKTATPRLMPCDIHQHVRPRGIRVVRDGIKP